MYTIEIPHKKKVLKLPNSWEELTYSQFLGAVSMLMIYATSKVEPIIVKIDFLKTIINYKDSGKIFDKEERSQIGSNLAIMASAFDFLFKDNEPNFAFKRFMSPDFEINGVRLKAPYFEIINSGSEEIFTNISAAQFTDAWEYFNLYASTNNFGNVIQLVAVLYTDFKNYSPQKRAENARLLKTLPEVETYAIFLQFKSIIEYVMAHGMYALLFQSGKKGNNKISLGFGGQILTLSQKGYGDYKDLLSEPFTDFLAMLIDMMINDVKMLKAYDKKPGEIAKETGLPMSTIKQII